MRLINKSRWRTRDLQAFVIRAARVVFDAEEWRDLKPRFVITFVTGRHGITGNAYLNGGPMRMRIAKYYTEKTINKFSLAQVLVHEFGHVKGLDHDAMRGAGKYDLSGRSAHLFEWARDLPLRLKEPKVAKTKTTVEKRLDRLETIRAHLKNWERKEKLAKTKLKIWKRKERELLYRMKRAAGAKREVER